MIKQEEEAYKKLDEQLAQRSIDQIIEIES